jgi:hypothetical protein
VSLGSAVTFLLLHFGYTDTYSKPSRRISGFRMVGPIGYNIYPLIDCRLFYLAIGDRLGRRIAKRAVSDRGSLPAV